MTSRSSRWYPSDSKVWVSSTETHLLLQDFELHIVPYRTNPQAYQLCAEGVPSSHIEESLELGNQGRKIDDFVRTTTSNLLRDHEIWLEVAFDDNLAGRTPFRVYKVDGVRQTREGSLVQEPPTSDQLPQWYQGEMEWETAIELDSDRMIHITMPNAYPSKLITQVVHDLAGVAPNTMPTWAMKRLLGQGEDTPHFDVNEAWRTERLRIAQAALPIGWTAREELLGQSRTLSEYYFYWREFRFLHFRSSMRERAEEAVRQILALAGERCGFKASVTAAGLYTPIDVERLLHKFEAGKIDFAMLNDIIFERVSSACSDRRRIV